jgi:hypothetical protein
MAIELLCVLSSLLLCVCVRLVHHISLLEQELAMAYRVIQIDTQLMCIQDQASVLEDQEP